MATAHLLDTNSNILTSRVDVQMASTSNASRRILSNVYTKGPKTIFLHAYFPFKPALLTKKLSFMHLSIFSRNTCKDMFQLQMHPGEHC